MNINFKQFDKSTYPYLDDSYVDDYIPVCYGKIAAVKLTPVNSNQDTDNGDIAAVYRMPEGMSSYGTPYVYVDDTWKSASISSADYDTGLITVSNGRADSGSTYDCKLVDCYGYMFDGHSYARQILQHWYSNYGSIEYTDSNFNKTEWEAELDDSRYQCDIGILLDDYSDSDDGGLDYFNKIVYQISTMGGKMLARVDYNAEGKITARLKDFDRVSSAVFASSDIKNASELSGSTSSDSSYSAIVEKYYKNYAESDDDDKYLSFEDTTYQQYVKQNFRITQSYTDETYLINKADALIRAAEIALELKDTRVEFTVDLYDDESSEQDVMGVRLYDVITVALSPDSLDASARAYAGNHDCLVVGINPKLDDDYNEVTIQIISDREASVQQAAVRTGAYTTVSREKSSLQIIADTVTDNLLLTGNLTVPSITVVADSTGAVSDFSAATGTFNVKYSGTDVTGDGPVYSVVSQTGCIGTIDAATGIYAVTALSADVGILLLKATYEGKSIETGFTVTKAYTGASAANIWLVLSSDKLARATSGDYTPATITLHAKYKNTSGDTADYPGRFKVEESTDGTTYTTKYTSTADESSYVYTPTAGITTARITLYEAGGTTTFEDQHSVVVLSETTGYIIFVDNQFVSFGADSAGSIGAPTTYTARVYAYYGTTSVPFRIGDITAPDGMTVTKLGSTITITSLTGTAMALNGGISIPVHLYTEDAYDIGDADYIIGDDGYYLGAYVDSTGDIDVTTGISYAKIVAGEAGNAYGVSMDKLAFEKTRAGVVTPASATVSATLSKGSVDPSAYSGRFVIYTTLDGTTYTSDYTSSADEANHTYTMPTTGISGIRIELYASGGTAVLLASAAYGIPYAASVAPEYLGIGILTATGTMAFTGATVADDGTITPGSSVSAIITGDWMVGYVASTMIATVYYWSGSAWTVTTDQKYVSAAAFDIMNLTTGGYSVANYTVIMNAIIKNLMVQNLKLLSGGALSSGNYDGSDDGGNDGTVGVRIGYEGNADFNGNTHIGGTLTVDGNGSFGSGCKFSGLITQGCNFYIAAKIIINFDVSVTWDIHSNNPKYSTFSRLNTGRFVIPIPADDRAYGIPRVICHYCSDVYESSVGDPSLTGIADNTYHPENSNALHQCLCRSGLNVFRYLPDGTRTEYLPLYFTDNQIDDFVDPVYALITLIYI